MTGSEHGTELELKASLLKLYQTYDVATDEYDKLYDIIDNLREEYTNSKHFFIYKRYKEFKRIIKNSVRKWKTVEKRMSLQMSKKLSNAGLENIIHSSLGGGGGGGTGSDHSFGRDGTERLLPLTNNLTMRIRSYSSATTRDLYAEAQRLEKEILHYKTKNLQMKNGCYFDGKLYARNEEIVIANCLGVVTCLGSDVLGNMEQWGGVCPKKRQLSGQTGCLFDGKVYKAGEKIVIANCLGEMTCLGNNNLGDLVSWGGICPEKRQLSGQTGCLFDGKVYKAGEKIVIANCLGEMTCLGNNNLGDLVSWGGVCPVKREVDGQSGCLFDGRIYNAGEKVIIQKCLGQMTCLGRNSYSPIKSLGGDCSKSD